MRAWIDEESLANGYLQVYIDMEGEDPIETINLPDGTVVAVNESEGVETMDGKPVLEVYGIEK